MMKRKLLIIGLPVFAGLLTVLWVTARLTGWLNMYNASSESNLPAIKTGSLFLLTNLKHPKRYDFIGYKHYDEISHTNQVYLHRLIGLPGDTLEIRGGTVFINGRDADSGLILTHTYAIPPGAHIAFDDLDQSQIRPGTGDTIIAMLPTNSPLITARIKRLRSWGAGYADDEMGKIWHGAKWDAFNFGPVVVPRHKLFVLGDNRENAMDSRYTGFIPEKDIVGVKL